ncbi:phage tail protein [Spongiivirga citrea]|uniref:Phage tail protein n=1 Tax=Spongiivirga citrea TaxID=1481457 RepID=A0A6M0CFG1_9FLAO|nr:phage tail protein [Spongiivirga citrea]NER16598.1 hypothetical protein [Spongiivirga citrea]
MPSLHTYPPLNVHFNIEFRAKTKIEVEPFQSITGLQAKLIKEEGDKNPLAVYENIVLRRAYNPNSNIVTWCMQAINNKVFQSKNMTIQLLDSKHELISAWEVENAIPVAWGVEELHAQNPKILIEVIELKYQRFHVLNSKARNVAPLKRSRKAR